MGRTKKAAKNVATTGTSIYQTTKRCLSLQFSPWLIERHVPHPAIYQFPIKTECAYAIYIIALFDTTFLH